jgi:hypothetical protein
MTCDILLEAQRIAEDKSIVCLGCDGNPENCSLLAKSNILPDPKDHRQDEALAHIEGAVQVKKFYSKLEKHQALVAH